MKKILTSVALVLASVVAFGQESYTVKMNMKIEGLPPEYAGFGESEIVSYQKGDKFKSEVTSMMMSSTTSFDGKKLVSIQEAMGEKSGFYATKEELDAANKEKKDEGKPKIEYTADKKMIAGYECSKALITPASKDKKEKPEVVTVWFTEKIKKPEHSKAGGRKSMQMMDFGDLKGYPLEFEWSSKANGQDMKFMCSTTEVSTGNIDDTAFNINTDGYKLLTYKEFTDKMKAAQAKGGN
jgi:hypothetical protein